MIKVPFAIHKRLSILKAKLGLNTFGDVFKYLLDKEDAA